MICLLLREADAFIMAIPRPRMHLRYAQPRIPVYLSRAKDISGFLAYRQPNHQPILLAGHKNSPAARSGGWRVTIAHNIGFF
jgi:hypothetical protein